MTKVSAAALWLDGTVVRCGDPYFSSWYILFMFKHARFRWFHWWSKLRKTTAVSRLLRDRLVPRSEVWQEERQVNITDWTKPWDGLTLFNQLEQKPRLLDHMKPYRDQQTPPLHSWAWNQQFPVFTNNVFGSCCCKWVFEPLRTSTRIFVAVVSVVPQVKRFCSFSSGLLCSNQWHILGFSHFLVTEDVSFLFYLSCLTVHIDKTEPECHCSRYNDNKRVLFYSIGGACSMFYLQFKLYKLCIVCFSVAAPGEVKKVQVGIWFICFISTAKLLETMNQFVWEENRWASHTCQSLQTSPPLLPAQQTALWHPASQPSPGNTGLDPPAWRGSAHILRTGAAWKHRNSQRPAEEQL